MRAAIERIQPDPGTSFHCHRRSDPAFDFRWHFHPEYELTLITSSRGRRFVGDHIDDYRTGDFVLLGPNLPHTWQSVGHRREVHEAVVVQFHDEFLGNELFDHAEFREIKRLLKRSSRGLRFTGHEVKAAAKIVEGVSEREGIERLLSLFDALHRLCNCPQTQSLAGERYFPSLALEDNRRIDQIFGYLMEHLEEPIRQEEVARLVHMSPSSFSRFFKRATGHTFVEYLNGLRVSQACWLLSETDLRVTEIAFRVGFESLSYFNRRFKKHKGMTANQFRRAYQENV